MTRGIDERLSELLDGEIAPPEREALEAELRARPESSAQLEALRALDRALADLPRIEPRPGFETRFRARERGRPARAHLGPRDGHHGKAARGEGRGSPFPFADVSRNQDHAVRARRVRERIDSGEARAGPDLVRRKLEQTKPSRERFEIGDERAGERKARAEGFAVRAHPVRSP